MAAVDDLDEVLEQFHQGQGEFAKGNPEPCKRFFSHREDVTLNNPSSPPTRGWDEVAETMDRGASPFKDGKFLGAETIAKCVTAELAYIVEIERARPRWAEPRRPPLGLLGPRCSFDPKRAPGRLCIGTQTPQPPRSQQSR